MQIVVQTDQLQIVKYDIGLCKYNEYEARNWQARKELYKHKEQFKLLYKHR